MDAQKDTFTLPPRTRSGAVRVCCAYSRAARALLILMSRACAHRPAILVRALERTDQIRGGMEGSSTERAQQQAAAAECQTKLSASQ